MDIPTCSNTSLDVDALLDTASVSSVKASLYYPTHNKKGTEGNDSKVAPELEHPRKLCSNTYIQTYMHGDVLCVRTTL